MRHRPLAARAIVGAVIAASVLHSSTSVALGAAGEIYPQKVVGELRQAVSFAFDPDGRIWFVEKAVGDIRIFDPTTGEVTRFFTVPDVFAEAEQGLVGIALPPGFPDTPYVYVYATRSVDGTLRDQLIRITVSNDRATGTKILWDSAASAQHEHSGGRLLFGPDGMLYMTVGDALDPALAQDVQSDRGKILRLAADGRRAPGDPFGGSSAFAFGIRNSFGIAFDPQTGSLWETENGPECNDEVNRVPPGANLGWGTSGDCVSPNDPLSTNRDGPGIVEPQLSFTPTTAPAGIAFCDGCGLGRASEGALFFGTYNTGAINRVILDADRENVVRDGVVAQAPDIALSLEVGPDHAIYFSSYIAIFRLELRGKPSPTPSPTPSPSPSGASPGSRAPPSPSARSGGSSTAAIGLVAVGVLVLTALTFLTVRALASRRRRSADPRR